MSSSPYKIPFLINPSLTFYLGEELDLWSYLEEAAKELAGESARGPKLRAEIQEAEAGLKRLADAVAVDALDMEAARRKALELREKRERAEKRLATINSGEQLGAELRKAISLVAEDLDMVLARMDGEKSRALVRLVFRQLTVEAHGGPRRRIGKVTAYEFTPECQEFWLTHSKQMMGHAEQQVEL